jgi:hypothetical protein
MGLSAVHAQRIVLQSDACAGKREILATRNAMAACLVAISENRCTVLWIINFFSQITIIIIIFPYRQLILPNILF